MVTVVPFRILAYLVIILGIIYPSMVYLVGILVFPYQAGGSLIKGPNNVIIGSQLIGQNFNQKRYFWPRPSAVDYNAMNSGGANLAFSSAILQENIIQRAAKYDVIEASIPIEALTHSASGLDPHISYEMAKQQIPRIAKNRKLTHYQVINLMDNLLEKPTLGFFGVEKLNVLKLNIELDKRFRRN